MSTSTKVSGLVVRAAVIAVVKERPDDMLFNRFLCNSHDKRQVPQVALFAISNAFISVKAPVDHLRIIFDRFSTFHSCDCRKLSSYLASAATRTMNLATSSGKAAPDKPQECSR